MLNEKGIVYNWNIFMEKVGTEFVEPRRQLLLDMYNSLEDRLSICPASDKEHFHNAFPGGYIDHVLNVINFSKQIYKLWRDNGAIIDYSEEELIFAAMHHDLGKVGDLNEDYYVENDSQWHRNNMGLMYKFNGNINYMTVSDRAFYILQHFGIIVSQNEWLGIRLADGLYEEANKSYYIQNDPLKHLKTNICHVIHQADIMASRIEYEKWILNKKENCETYKYSKKFNQYNKLKKKVENFSSVGTDDEKEKLFNTIFTKQ